MKKHFLLLLAIMNALQSFARNFSYEYEGQNIIYTVLDENAKICSTADGNWYGTLAGNVVSGDLILPSNPKDGGVEYTLTTIGSYAFKQCRELTSIVIPNSVTAIGDFAFSGCSSLASIEIPNSVNSLGFFVFEGCCSLTSIEIPDSVTLIENGTFSNCNGLTSIDIPNSVTAIGTLAFYNCSGLTSIEIPNSVTAIGCLAFHNCSGLASIEIPNSVTAIYASAFEGCIGLTWVIIPYSVTTFQWSVFKNCSSLIKTAYPSTMANPFEAGVNIKYPAKGAIIENGVVYGADKSAIYFAPLGLEGDFIISDSVEAISLYSFYKCEGITSVEIPGSVTSIDSNAFDGCIGLTSVILSKNLKKIGTKAFDGCERIKTIIYPTQNPCVPGKEIFMIELYRKTTLYVPDEAINTFKSIAPWSAFNHIIGLEASGIEDAMNNYDNSEIDCSAPYDVYNLNGVKVCNSTDNLAPGLYIIRQGSLSKKIMH